MKQAEWIISGSGQVPPMRKVTEWATPQTTFASAGRGATCAVPGLTFMVPDVNEATRRKMITVNIRIWVTGTTFFNGSPGRCCPDIQLLKQHES